VQASHYRTVGGGGLRRDTKGACRATGRKKVWFHPAGSTAQLCQLTPKGRVGRTLQERVIVQKTKKEFQGPKDLGHDRTRQRRGGKKISKQPRLTPCQGREGIGRCAQKRLLDRVLYAIDTYKGWLSEFQRVPGPKEGYLVSAIVTGCVQWDL